MPCLPWRPSTTSAAYSSASASSERLLDMWLERDDDPVDRMGPRVLPDGTRGPDRNVFHTISVDGTGQRMDVRAKIPSSYMHLIGTMIACVPEL